MARRKGIGRPATISEGMGRMRRRGIARGMRIARLQGLGGEPRKRRAPKSSFTASLR